MRWGRASSVVRVAALGSVLPALLLLAAAREVQAVELHVLAAGATESTMRAMVGIFEREAGTGVKLTYGAVGLLRDKIYAGEPADLTIVTPAIIEQLLAKGLVRPETRTDVGRVGGGIAVRMGAARPAVGTADELKQALLAAQEIYYANPATATAGAYFLKVADQLGVMDAVKQKGRTGAGGKEAMEMMARSTADAIGLTQISEILSVKEVVLIGPYPGNLQAMTTYTGIMMAKTPHAEAAQAFLRWLKSPAVQAKFKEAGYEPAP